MLGLGVGTSSGLGENDLGLGMFDWMQVPVDDWTQ